MKGSEEKTTIIIALFKLHQVREGAVDIKSVPRSVPSSRVTNEAPAAGIVYPGKRGKLTRTVV